LQSYHYEVKAEIRGGGRIGEEEKLEVEEEEEGPYIYPGTC
jgi:hypothetical protein